MSDPHPNGKAALCWLKRMILGLGAVAGAIIVIFTAASQLDRYRWWASAEELKIVANRVYQTSIPEQRRIIASIERDLRNAKKIPVKNRDVNDEIRIDRLAIELRKAQETMTDLQLERKMFK